MENYKNPIQVALLIALTLQEWGFRSPHQVKNHSRRYFVGLKQIWRLIYFSSPYLPSINVYQILLNATWSRNISSELARPHFILYALFLLLDCFPDLKLLN